MAANFLGTGGTLQRLSVSNLNGLSALTFMAFIKSNIVSTDRGWIKHALPDGTDRFITARYDVSGFSGGGTNVIKAGIQLNGNVEHNAETVSGLQTTDWQHVCVRWESGSDIQIVVDGVDQTDPGSISGGNTGTTSGTDRILLGQGGKDGGSLSWDGILDDFRFYSRYLSIDEILTIINSDGGDDIVEGLQYRYIFGEGAPSSPIPTTVNLINDISGNGNALTRSGAVVNFSEGISVVG
jgi:hypothetical protein